MAQKNIIRLSEVTAPAYKCFWRTEKTYVVCKGSRGSGKSKHAALWIISQMMRYPLANTLVVRKVLDTMRDSVCADLIWAIKRLKVQDYWDFPEKKSSPLLITYKPTGQKIIFKGLDNAAKVTSVSVSTGVLCWMFIEEAFEIDDENDFNMLDESIRGELPDGYFKRVILVFNPWSDSTWLKSRFFDGDHDNVLAMTTTYKDNPWLSDTDLEAFEDMRKTRPDRYKVAGLGEWGVDGSTFFDQFSESIHVVTPFVIPDHWEITRAIDYGLDALACLYVAVDPHDVAYVVGEVYKHGLIVSDAAQAIIDGAPRKQDYITYAPPDMWSRTKDTGRTMAEIYMDNGVYLTKASNDRIQGWAQVHERLKPLPDPSGEGKTARLQIFSTCKNLIRCLSTIKADEKNCNDAAKEPHEVTHLCVSGDTLVMTPDGPQRIDALPASGIVMAYDGVRAVQATYGGLVCTSDSADVYEVELEDGTKIKATASHPVLTVDGWETVGALHPGSDLVIAI